MAIELRSSGSVSIAVVSGALGESTGQELASLVVKEVPRGGKLVVEGSGVTSLDQDGVLHLMAIQRWAKAPERTRLAVAGFAPAVWRTLADNVGDELFEPRPTLEEALQTFGAGPAQPWGPKDAPPSEDPPGDGPVIWQRPGNSPPPPLGKRTPPSPIQPNSWDTFPPRPPAAKPSGGRRISPRALSLGTAGAAALLLLLAGWWLLAHRAPSLTVSPGEIIAEEGGKEVEGVTVKVQRGHLKNDDLPLPEGLHFDAMAESSSRYVLTGSAANGAKSTTVQLIAESADGAKSSAPVSFTVTIAPKPLTWETNALQSLPLHVGAPIRADSKFLIGSPRTPTATGLPPGLTVARCPDSATDWQLAGTPEQAGDFEVKFHAVKDSATEEKTCQLKVVTTPTTPSPSPTPMPPPPTPPSVDDGMRKFLLQRIEKLPSSYPDDDRENLRLVVNGLTKARLVCKVNFGVQSHDVSPEEAAKLKAALQAPENASLLGEDKCQLVIVGYASTSGSMSKNVLLSKQRAHAVEVEVHRLLGRNADLCGDYGPTDAADQAGDRTNRAAEVYAGTIDVPPLLVPRATAFKDDFNRRHGLH